MIPRSETSVPPDINSLLDAANSGLQAIPRDNLKTAIDESYTAVGGLGPQLSDIVKGSTSFGDRCPQESRPADRSDRQLQAGSRFPGPDVGRHPGLGVARGHGDRRTAEATNDAVAGVIDKGGFIATSGEAKRLIERLQPTLPIVWPIWSSVGQVAVTYQTRHRAAAGAASPCRSPKARAPSWPMPTPTRPTGASICRFNLNLNLPPACTTGFLPAQQARIPTLDRLSGSRARRPVLPHPAGLAVQCPRGPQHPVRNRARQASPDGEDVRKRRAVRAAERRLQLEGRPQRHVTGQDIPQLPPGSPPAAAPTAPPPPPIAVAQYDPATGTYVGPDGKVYTQSDLAQTRRRRRHGRRC